MGSWSWTGHHHIWYFMHTHWTPCMPSTYVHMHVARSALLVSVRTVPCHPISSPCIASLYQEPVQSTVDQPRSSSLLSPGVPYEYLEPLPSPTPVVDVPPDNQQENGSTPMQNSTEPASPVCSTARNPMYSSPELHELYVDLGELEPINLMAFSYQIASGMVR